MLFMFRCIAMGGLTFVLGFGTSAAQFGGLKKQLTDDKKEEKAVDVKEVKIEDVLSLLSQTRTYFQKATRAISEGRDVLFDISATTEQKNQIADQVSTLDGIGDEKQKREKKVEIAQEKDQVIMDALKEGKLESQELSVRQLKNAGKLTFNLLLAVLLDKEALESGKKIKTDGPLALKQLQSDRSSALKKRKEMKIITDALKAEVPEIIKEVPNQLETLDAFLNAMRVLQKADNFDAFEKPQITDEFFEIDF